MDDPMAIIAAINIFFAVLVILGLVAIVYSLESLYKIVKKKFATNPDKRRGAFIRLGLSAVYSVLFLVMGTNLVVRFVTLPVATYRGVSIVIDGHEFVEITRNIPEAVRSPGRLDLVRVARDETPPGAGVMALFNIPFYAERGASWPPEFIFYDFRPWRIFQLTDEFWLIDEFEMDW